MSVDRRCIYELMNPGGTIRYKVRVVVGRRRVTVTCPTLEEAIVQRDLLQHRADAAIRQRRDRKARGADKREVIYFVQAGESGPIKIGRTRVELVTRRVANLQIASYLELRLLGTVEGDSQGERELHRRLKHLRVRGEWFEDSEAIRGVISDPPRWLRGSSVCHSQEKYAA